MVPSIETEGLWAELEQLRREAVVLAWAEEAMDAQGWRVTVRAGRIDGDLVVQVEARVAGLERPKAETPPRDALIAEERPIHPSAAAGRSMVAVSPVAVVATSWSTEDDLDLYQAAEDGRPIAEVAQDLERPHRRGPRTVGGPQPRHVPGPAQGRR